ncbi:DUF896 domain-containing protein [Paenibacillus farraposensis]|uniref:UPF0291 protein ACFQ5D_12205 n=1 Tax=Paenibacillus farraposensis TaxID=2807095 RepID=A0ABW4DE79_9BACL|nr:DUF896 domain-containing protein [Paenibacillus farraposensis]MCC3381096.1 DUF896 domain-containing protein [Paenibacillus farraposensis]
MDIDSLVQRINELARKAKSEGLTEEETIERANLREIYLGNIRRNFRQQLETIEFVDDDTPEGKRGPKH